MPTIGTDLTTLIKTEGTGTAQNLKITATNLTEHEPALKAALEHQEKATGGSSQDDMRLLRTLVTSAIGRERTCTSTVASAAVRCQKIVDEL